MLVLTSRIKLASAARRKTASIGGMPEKSFERSFCDIAWSYVKDAAPGLVDSAKGFQLVERNADNTRAIGVFGFQTGSGAQYYVPVFFLNGDVKGHELLYLPKSKVFVPLKENWINYLVKRKPDNLGEQAEGRRSELKLMAPDLDVFRRPRYQKLAEWPAPPIVPAGTFPEAEAIARKAAQHLPTPPTLTEVLAEPAFWKSAWALYNERPEFKAGVDKFYGGLDLFISTGQPLAEAEKQAQHSSLLTGVSKPEPKSAYVRTKSNLLGKTAEEKSPRKLDTVVFDSMTYHSDQELSPEEKTKLRREGLVFIDRRSNDDVNVVYRPQMELQLENPNGTGVYDLLVAPDKLVRALVCTQPFGDSDDGNTLAVLLDGDDKGYYCICPRNQLWGKPEPDPKRGWDQWGSLDETLKGGVSFDSLPEKPIQSDDSTPMAVNEPYKRKSYVGVTPRGQATAKFSPSRWGEVRDDAVPISFSTCPTVSDCASSYPTRHRSTGNYCPSPNYLRQSEVEGAKLRVIGDELVVPPDIKFLEIKDKTFRPASVSHVVEALTKRAGARVKAWTVGSEFVFNEENGTQKRLYKTAALRHLVEERNLRESTARAILDDMTREPAVLLFKYAGPGPYLYDTNVSAPAMNDGSDSYSGSEFGSYPTQIPYSELAPVQGMQSEPREPLYTREDDAARAGGQSPQGGGGSGGGGNDLSSAAGQAVQNGDKEAFDVSGFASILKASRPDSIVDKNLGRVIGAMSALGEILMAVYWHKDYFEDRYGKSDLPELEDGARNAFEAVGDVALFLREKEVRPFGEAGEQFGTTMGDETTLAA